MLGRLLTDVFVTGSDAADESAGSVVVSARAGESSGNTSGVNAATGMALGVVTTTHRGPDHVLPLLRLAPKTSPDRLAAAIATTSRALKLLFMLIPKSFFLVRNTDKGDSSG